MSPGTVNTSSPRAFRPAGAVRDNGVPVSANRGGFQAGANSGRRHLHRRGQCALVEDDFNDTTYTGYRLSGAV
jgi:iron complex outermembrane receptor protein